jgi:hypothetical protein
VAHSAGLLHGSHEIACRNRVPVVPLEVEIASREMVAEAKEQVSDIIAEVHAEDDAAEATSKRRSEVQKT